MSFEGYPAESLDFLARLPSRDPKWFKSNRQQYTRLVADPTKAFVAALGEKLQELSPHIVAEPKTNGSIGPINNDLRFTPGKAPYKNHVLLRFWEGTPKKTAPTLFVRLAPDNVGFAAGIVPADIDGWREFVAGKDGARLDAEVRKLAGVKKADVEGRGLKRVPSPYPADHPRGELLRHKMLQVRWPEPVPSVIDKPAFVGWCLEQLRECLPLHRLLVKSGL